MNNILNQICKYKREYVDIQRKKVTEKELQIMINDSESPREFKKKQTRIIKIIIYQLQLRLKKQAPLKE